MRLTCTLLAALSLSLSLLPPLTAAQSADECSTPPSGPVSLQSSPRKSAHASLHTDDGPARLSTSVLLCLAMRALLHRLLQRLPRRARVPTGLLHLLRYLW